MAYISMVPFRHGTYSYGLYSYDYTGHNYIGPLLSRYGADGVKHISYNNNIITNMLGMARMVSSSLRAAVEKRASSCGPPERSGRSTSWRCYNSVGHNYIGP